MGVKYGGYGGIRWIRCGIRQNTVEYGVEYGGICVEYGVAYTTVSSLMATFVSHSIRGTAALFCAGALASGPSWTCHRSTGEKRARTGECACSALPSSSFSSMSQLSERPSRASARWSKWRCIVEEGNRKKRKRA